MFAWNDADWNAAATIGHVMPDLSDESTGMMAGTKVATTFGWRPVEAVAAGDMVLTFDGGMQPVKEVVRRQFWCTDSDPEDWPLHVPAGALGNRGDMHVLPRQLILVESDTAEAVLGDPFALIPAAALDGFRGIARVRPGEVVEAIELRFEAAEIAYANIGALFLCPAAGDLLSPGDSAYVPLDLERAHVLVDCLAEEDRGYVPAAEAAPLLRLVA